MTKVNELLAAPVECSRRCGWETPATADAQTKRANHEHRWHDEPLPAQAVEGKTWREKAGYAVQQVAARGVEFTMYAALAEFGLADPPNAKTAIGTFSSTVHDLGWAHPVAFEHSQRSGTKRSAVAVWHRDGRKCMDEKCRRKAGI